MAPAVRIGTVRGAQVLVLMLLAAALTFAGAVSPAYAQMQLTVDSTLDEPDAVVNDNQCMSTPSAKCTLRAAVQEIDNGGTVMLPAGLYVLGIPSGSEAVPGSPIGPATGDLDIVTDVTIAGAGAERTVIDGNNDHRLFDIHAPNGFAHISGVSVRSGKAEFSAPTGHRHGGIIHNHGKLELFESTVSDGVADAGAPWGGAGITNAGNGTATLRNVTVARNRTTYFGGGIENGGAINLSYVTLAENTAPTDQGAGISSGVGFFAGQPGETTLQNTIVAKNTGGNCRGGTIASNGYNLEDAASCPFINPGDQFGTDPKLRAENNTAGSLFVFGLEPGSPAIDKASPLVCAPTDERGVTRPQDGDGIPPDYCDIGAYERGPDTPTCDGRTATIVGTAGNDEIRGTENSDVIVALGGDDKVSGHGGKDTICGGAGKDQLRGDDGADRLFGEADKDNLRGGKGDDLLDGGPKDDRCDGGPGADIKVRCER